MDRRIVIRPLDAAFLAPFGDVIEAGDTPTQMINGGACARFTDLATLDFGGQQARAGISVFDAQPCELPLMLDLVERHPLGSQAFLPMSGDPFLVVVAPDEGGVPGTPLAFLTAPGQGVNYRRGTWHGVLTPLGRRAPFAVIDRIGPGSNLEEYRYAEPWKIVTA